MTTQTTTTSQKASVCLTAGTLTKIFTTDWPRWMGTIPSLHQHLSPGNSSAQSSFTTDFAGPRQSPTFGDGGTYYPGPVWTASPQEAAETPHWPSASKIIAVPTNNGVGRAQPPAVTASIQPYNVLPLSASSPSSITLQSMGNEHVEPPFYVSQQGFELPPTGEMGETPFYHSSLYVPSTPFPAKHYLHSSHGPQEQRRNTSPANQP